MSVRFKFLPLALLLTALLSSIFPAAAHANLTDATPAANAKLDMPPTDIRLTFSEMIEPDFSRITVLALSGEEVARGGEVAPDAPYTLTLVLPPDLEHDVYTVRWRVVSLTDGHATEGTYPFGVGMAAGTRTVVAIVESGKPEVIAARVLDMAGTALTLGVVLFAALVWRRGEAQGLPPREAAFTRLLRAGWVIAGLGLMMGLLAQAATVSGGTLGSVFGDGSIGSLLTGSAYGHLWIVRVVLWAGFGAFILRSADKPVHTGVLLALSIGLAIVPSMVSHARAIGSIDALINDMLHRVMAGLWIGGLVAWVAALLPDLALPVQAVSRAVMRFSNLARFYVLLLAAGGLFAALQHIPDGDALASTAYGRGMTVKGVLFALMLALAAFNLLVVEPRLKRGLAGWIATFRVTVSAEMMLGLMLMLISAVIASTIPARITLDMRAEAEALAAAPQGKPYFGMVVQDGVMVHLEVYPGLAGENEFIVTPYDFDTGEPITDASRVRLRFTHLTQNLGESMLTLTDEGGGVYRTTASNLSIAGDWQVRVTLQRPDAFDNVMDFALDIPLP